MAIKFLSNIRVGNFLFPTVDGTAGQVLGTDGNGNLTFMSAATADKYINGLTFSSGTLTASVAGGSDVSVSLDGRYALTSHNHAGVYDNYQFWNLKTNGTQRTTVQSGGVLDLVAGSNVSLSYSAGGVVTISSNDAYTGTVTSVSGTGSVSGLTLTGTVTSSGSLTLGGTLTLTSGQVTTALGYTPYQEGTALDASTITLPQNPTGTTYGNGVASTPTYYIGQAAGDNDAWKLYGESSATNTVSMVFEVNDDIEVAGSEWIFRNKKTYGDYSATTPFRISGAGAAYISGNIVYHAGNFTDNSSNWNTAYSWGNHATAGYLTSVTNISGNAGTATTLQTARAINGTAFNGSADITTSFWGSTRTITIGSTGKSVNGSGNVSWTLAEIGAPSTTGTGASGTWAISISGNAATASSAVYANSAGTAGSVTGLTLNSSGNPINPDNVTQNQLGYNTNVSLFGQTDGGLYSSAYSSSWIHQIYGDFRSGQIAVRGKNNGSWQPWRTVLDSSNFSSWAQPAGSYAAASHTHTPSQVGLGNVTNDTQVAVTYNTTLNSDTRNRRGVTRLFRRDDDSDFSVQTYWTGSYWRLYGYYGDDGHADTHVGYADSSGYSSSTGSVAWSNVSGRPTALSSFTNDSGYVTSSALGSYLSLSGGTMTGKITGPSTGSDTYGGLMEVRERGYVLATQSDWSYSPAITFHWGNRAAIRFGLRSDGQMAVDNNALITSANIGSQSVNYSSSTGSVAWTNVSGRPTAVSSFTNDSGYITASAAVARGEFRAFGTQAIAPNGANATCTTAQFISTLSSIGMFNYTHAVLKCSWDYAGNNDITDTGFGQLELAGCVIETWSDGSNKHVRVTRPTTGSGGFQTLVYNDQGSGYSPGWRQLITSENIGSQSVNYASSAGSVAWGNVSSKPSNLTYWDTWYGSSYLGSDGNLYMGWAGAWLSTWLNQSVKTDADPTFRNVYATGWFRNYGQQGIYNQDYGTHFYSVGSGVWGITGSGSGVELQFRANHQSTIRGYVYGDTSNNFGFLNDQGGWAVRCYSGSGYGGALTGTWTASGDLVAYSDARVKENIKTIDNALDKVLSLRGVEYNRTDSKDKSKKVGVIAQEIKEVLPEVVFEQEDGMLGVSYGNIVGVLIEAIKEQQKQIDELKAKLK